MSGPLGVCSPAARRAADLPLVPAPLLRALLATPAEHAVAVAGGRVQPLCARLGPAALGPLEAALTAGEPATRAVLALQPSLVEADAAWLLKSTRPPTSRQRRPRCAHPSAPAASVRPVLLLARLVCSEAACADHLVEVHAATLAELEALACECGCALHVVGWPDVVDG